MLFTAAVSLILWGLRVGWMNAQRRIVAQEIRNDFKGIELGLGNYKSIYGSWPSPARLAQDGTLLYSWRFQLAPYMINYRIGGNYKTDWRSQDNSRWRNKVHEYFSIGDNPLETETRYFGIAGKRAAFDLANSHTRESFPVQLIMVMEVADSGVHWMEPGDYDVDALLAATGKLGDAVKGILPDRFYVMFANGEVWALSPETPMETVKPFFTIDGAREASRDQLLGAYRVD